MYFKFLPSFYVNFSDKLMGKPFQITDYGVCFIEDLFNEIPESTIAVCDFDTSLICWEYRRQIYKPPGTKDL